MDGASTVPILQADMGTTVTFLVAAVAHHELQPIDVRRLQQLRYEYKGA